MYKGLIILLVAALSIIAMIIGIPSRVLDQTIDENTFQEIKNVQQILTSTKEEISLDSLPGLFSPLAPDDFGYIDSPEKVDQLFSFLPLDKLNTIKSILSSGKVEEIDILRPRCIRFTLKRSFNFFFLTNSWETLDLVFNDNCVCTCQNRQMDEESIKTEDLGDGWHKVSIITRRTLPHS